MRFSFRRPKDPLPEALEQCWQRLASGVPLEQVLASYPSQSEALRPLLLTALAASRVSVVAPREMAVEAGRVKVRAALEQALVGNATGEKALHEALNDCVTRLAGGATLEDCLALYPSYVGALQPLLATAAATRVASQVEPSPLGAVRARVKVHAAMERSRRRGFWASVLNLVPARAWATGGAAVVLFGGGFGVVQAASGSMPTDTLYPVKRTVEEVQLSWPMRSAAGRTRFHDQLARRRTEEAAKMADRGAPAQIVSLSDRAAGHVETATVIVITQAERGLRPYREPRQRPESLTIGPDEMQRFQRLLAGYRARLEFEFGYNMSLLQQVLATAPQEYQPRVRLAMEILTVQYQESQRQLDRKLEELSIFAGPQGLPTGPRSQFSPPTAVPLGAFQPR